VLVPLNRPVGRCATQKAPRPPAPSRVEIAGMWERLAHDVITSPDAAELLHVKSERKFVSMCVKGLISAA
jgi:hypothetical protein